MTYDTPTRPLNSRRLPVRDADLSAYARIRNAALEGFAANGVAATSIRDVAGAAEVSPGLVQHHFGTKAGLREAVDEYVIAVTTHAFEDVLGRGQQGDVWSTMGDAVTEWVRDNLVALRYIARGLVEGDPEAQRIFDALIEVARTYWLAPLRAADALRDDVDQEWATIHAIVFNLASVLFEPAINHHLPEPFSTPTQTQRWNAATTDLYRRGVSPQPHARRKRAPSGPRARKR
jgi:AcrR family transcriptional regulator